jgi:hypothetical protein
MALRQVGVSDPICDQLGTDLTAWLQHILGSKVGCLIESSLNLV